MLLCKSCYEIWTEIIIPSISILISILCSVIVIFIQKRVDRERDILVDIYYPCYSTLMEKDYSQLSKYKQIKYYYKANKKFIDYIEFLSSHQLFEEYKIKDIYEALYDYLIKVFNKYKIHGLLIIKDNYMNEMFEEISLSDNDSVSKQVKNLLEKYRDIIEEGYIDKNIKEECIGEEIKNIFISNMDQETKNYIKNNKIDIFDGMTIDEIYRSSKKYASIKNNNNIYFSKINLLNEFLCKELKISKNKNKNEYH